MIFDKPVLILLGLGINIAMYAIARMHVARFVVSPFFHGVTSVFAGAAIGMGIAYFFFLIIACIWPMQFAQPWDGVPWLFFASLLVYGITFIFEHNRESNMVKFVLWRRESIKHEAVRLEKLARELGLS